MMSARWGRFCWALGRRVDWNDRSVAVDEVAAIVVLVVVAVLGGGGVG